MAGHNHSAEASAAEASRGAAQLESVAVDNGIMCCLYQFGEDQTRLDMAGLDSDIV